MVEHVTDDTIKECQLLDTDHLSNPYKLVAWKWKFSCCLCKLFVISIKQQYFLQLMGIYSFYKLMALLKLRHVTSKTK